ncbi:MAG: YraN family protein [Betaproteobacteria bacterium]
MPNRQTLGRAGEELALKFLTAQGWRLLAQRFRSRYGELDLVGVEGDELVFVEVKTRATARCGTPEEALTEEKRRRLWKTAARFVGGQAPTRLRFDLVAVRVGAGEVAIRRYRNVWGRWS